MNTDRHEQHKEPCVSILKGASTGISARGMKKHYQYPVQAEASPLVGTLPLVRLLSREDRCCVLVYTNHETKTSAIAFAHRIEADLIACGVMSERLVLRLTVGPCYTTFRADLLFGGDSEDWWQAGEQISPERLLSEAGPTLSREDLAKRFRGMLLSTEN